MKLDRLVSGSLVLAALGATPLASSSLAAQVPARVVLERKHITLEPGDSARIEATVLDAEGNPMDAELVYAYVGRRTRSLNVDSRSGWIRAVKGGDFRLVAHVFDQRFFAQMDLREMFDMSAFMTVKVPFPPVERVEVAPGTGGTFYAGVVMRHEATVYDEAGDARTNVEVGWRTSDEAVATIDRYGVFNARAPGRVTLTATAEGVVGEVAYDVVASPVTSISLTAGQEVGRTGDVIRFEAAPMAGNTVTDVPVTFSVIPYAAIDATADLPPAEIDPQGRFVAYRAGVYTVMATVPGHAAHETIRIEPRNVGETVRFVGHAPVRDVRTSDLWVWEGVDGRDYAVTGTWSAGGATYWWDVTDPAAPVLVDSLVVDARTTNDVKVSEDGRICVFSREGASDRRNGIVIVDCSDPRNVEVLSTFDEGLTWGVHNVFIHEGHVYAVNRGSRFDVINIEDPANPYRVSEFRLPTLGREINDMEGTHDIWVVDGVAYTSNWGDGVAVIDVGGGDRGGSPSNPVLMYRFGDVGGSTHAAFPYWSPTGRFYIFMGDEIVVSGFNARSRTRTPPRMAGYIHVVDFTDPENPEEIARYDVPGAGSHNMWIDGDRLYAAFYNGGVRVIDISGELKGNLALQGRDIAHYEAHDPDGFIPNAPFTWGGQVHKGHLFMAEKHSGLWVVRLEPGRNLVP